MPVTPLHFGLNASVGILFRKYINIPLCVLSNVIIDIQPFLVIFFDKNMELHGFSHTLLGGSLIMLPISIIVGIYKIKIKKKELRMFSFVIGGEMGVVLHILLDSLMHKDVKIFWPISEISLANENTLRLVNPIWIAGYILMVILIIINRLSRKGIFKIKM